MSLPDGALRMDQPVCCRIRVQGVIGERWRDWLDGLEIEVQAEAEVASAATCLVGSLPDQAALLGLLQRLYALGYPILSVEVKV